MPFILGQVPALVTQIHYPPLSRLKAQGVLQTLEYQVAAFRAVAVLTQGGQRQRMGSPIGQTELAFFGEPGYLSIL